MSLGGLFHIIISIIFPLISFKRIFISLIIIELLLRAFGFETWKYSEHNLKEPTTNKYHPILGWKPKEGA